MRCDTTKYRRNSMEFGVGTSNHFMGVLLKVDLQIRVGFLSSFCHNFSDHIDIVFVHILLIRAIVVLAGIAVKHGSEILNSSAGKVPNGAAFRVFKFPL